MSHCNRQKQITSSVLLAHDFSLYLTTTSASPTKRLEKLKYRLTTDVFAALELSNPLFGEMMLLQ